MDITNLFKACVKTIRTRNKAFGLNSDPDKNRILATRTTKNEFTIKSREILKNISYLKDFLLENRKAYLNFAGHLSDMPQMSDVERNKIDSGAQSIMSSCSHLIQEFKKEITKNKDSPQTLEHRQAVLDVLENYLKAVCKIYSEQKAIRVKRTLELKKLSRLELEKPSNRGSSSNSTSAQIMKSESTLSEPVEVKSVARTPLVGVDAHQESYSFIEDDNLSQEEMQMYELENAHLLNELNSMTEEVKQVETKVVQIAELQEIFTEKVLQQEVEIDRISNTVVGTSENVKDANEQIRKAIQGNADLRAWILFFLLVMSFSLLFLDWYND